MDQPCNMPHTEGVLPYTEGALPYTEGALPYTEGAPASGLSGGTTPHSTGWWARDTACCSCCTPHWRLVAECMNTTARGSPASEPEASHWSLHTSHIITCGLQQPAISRSCSTVQASRSTAQARCRAVQPSCMLTGGRHQAPVCELLELPPTRATM